MAQRRRKKNSYVSKVVSIVLITFAIFFLVDVFKRVYSMFAL